MQCCFKLTEQVNNTAVALGFFDGLHRGHRSVIVPAAEQSKNGLTSVCLTFDKSPKSVITGIDVPMLMTHGDKIRTLESLGVDKTFFIDFKSVMGLGAEEFFDTVIAGALKAKKLFCGFNYRFGKNAEGDTRTLERLCAKYGIGLTVAPPYMIGREVVCSTLIKQKIADGRVREANLMLGSLFAAASLLSAPRSPIRWLCPTISSKLSGLILFARGEYFTVPTPLRFTFILLYNHFPNFARDKPKG